MSYLKDFQTHIAKHNYSGVLKLWEEYCAGDELDIEELKEILKSIKHSEMADSFGLHIQEILPLWQITPQSPGSEEIFKLIIDLQTMNDDALAHMTLDFLKAKYPNDPLFNEKIRLVGLRNREKFQGAVSNFELLSHMKIGNYVFHTGGWGVGEIVDFSFVLEQVSIEFDYVPGRKDLSFITAFKVLMPIPADHFLALRFGNPDLLEKKARKDPVSVIHMLLKDLGPKTTAEIKDELCDLIIPAKEWTRWWQATRSKLKKDTFIEIPEDIKNNFKLRQTEISHEQKLSDVLQSKPNADTLIEMVYGFLKDFPETLKNEEFKTNLKTKLSEALLLTDITPAQSLQIHFFLQDLKEEKESENIKEIFKNCSSIFKLIDEIKIISFKKRCLNHLQQNSEEWPQIFLDLLFYIDISPLRDYILSALLTAKASDGLIQKLEQLYIHPDKYPSAFIWYFQKVINQKALPLCDKQGRTRFFEGLLVLLSRIEHQPLQRDLVKKIHNLLSTDRFAIVRQIMQESSIEDVKEFLLLATKCHSLSDHEQKIFVSLAEVAYPKLAKLHKKEVQEDLTIWTTQEGYQKLQQRIQQIATVETVENAKEIEIARAHGDLRENAEFKAALERRDRLQSELKTLSDQMHRARILSKEDISTQEVGVGAIIDCKNTHGEKISYTILGPWDADPEKNILSFQSKLALTINGLSVGESFQFQEETFTIEAIHSYL
ncbi:GreA/GreB family elongation factor [Candidatus Rhabdochlamydia porcellionis]|jgi:transcription elongation factor GreA-like protein/transcription elongation GreA/GreB family factor|uniref:Transcription elongation factor GreA n=1 Tax=Candidatus Rhabdochlamydia porcellionis TaxID=225148 RepID=A0ABX8Z241_9BACT|nr:GreA/GreB family elongation factor [Candidatus Rhabdochlamydia porcellionis]QZA59435.1 Transcription elongation factor GreA [Candidatus Rhabdochlamydia porcellionis]